jgi:hypothetical protein
MTCSSSLAGTYTVTVKGGGGAQPHSTPVTVTVVNTSPSSAPTQPVTILGFEPAIFYAIVGGIIVLLAVVSAGVFLRSRNPKK